MKMFKIIYISVCALLLYIYMYIYIVYLKVKQPYYRPGQAFMAPGG